MTENHYADHAVEPLDKTDMEASVANTEQEWDTDQAVVHNMYIGWALALLHTQDITEIRHKGGNLVTVDMGAFQIDLVIPMPPSGWEP